MSASRVSNTLQMVQRQTRHKAIRSIQILSGKLWPGPCALMFCALSELQVNPHTVATLGMLLDAPRLATWEQASSTGICSGKSFRMESRSGVSTILALSHALLM